MAERGHVPRVGATITEDAQALDGYLTGSTLRAVGVERDTNRLVLDFGELALVLPAQTRCVVYAGKDPTANLDAPEVDWVQLEQTC